jgi:DNA processing protein
MKKFKTLLALWNDEMSLKSRDTLHLLELLTSIKNVEEASVEEIEGYLQAITENSSHFSSKAQELMEKLDKEKIKYYEDYIRELESNGKHAISFLDERYPQRLKEIEKPPLMLFVSGQPEALSNSVALVGTRDPNDHRAQFAEKIAEKIAEKGYTVTSGLARGIDTAGHEGALKEGKTAAILPGSLSEIHPKSNSPLAKRIERHGALVSEVSAKIDINRRRFVKRNRIISGISEAIVIGASGESGGTIHQARYAKQQDRDIMLYYREEDNQSPEKLIRTMDAKPFRSLRELELRLQELNSNKNKDLRAYA